MKQPCPATRNKIEEGSRGNGGRSRRDPIPGSDIFYRLAENSGELIACVRLAPEVRIIYVNPAFSRCSGYTPEECYEDIGVIIGHVHPDDVERFKQLLDADTPEDPEPVTLRGTKKDGSMNWLELTRTVIRDAAAKTVDAYFFCRDVTARKLTEEALKESQEFVSSLLENAPHATVVINPDTSIRYVNPIWEQINGWRLDEVIGLKAPYPWWPDDQLGQFIENFKTAMERESGQGEVISRKKNGELYWIAMNWAWVVHGREKRYMIVNSINVTERRKAEELREGENRILTLLSQGAGLNELLEAILRMGEAQDPSIRGSALLIDPAKGMLFQAAGPSLPEDYLRLMANGLPIGEGIGCCGTAAYRKERVVVPDIASSPLFYGDIVEVTKKNNMLACWSQPVISAKGELLGTIANYSNKAGEPNAQNLFLLEWSARIAAIAIARKQAEEQLRLLSSVTEQISEATIVADPNYVITYINRAAQDLFGYSLEEAIGKKLGLFNKEPIKKKRLREIMEVLSAGKSFSVLTMKKRKDGRLLLCDCLLSPLCDEEGRLIYYIDVERDVTQQKEMEQKLQEHKRLIENILATLPEGVMVVDGRDRVMLANQACYDIFHFARKSVETRPFHELIKIDELYNVYRSVRQGTAARNNIEVRCRVAGRDRIIASSVVKMDGERLLLIFADVSQASEDKEKLYLTDRLASIGEMAAGLAHELNNPLTAILTLSQLLLHHGLPGESQEDMKCIYEEAQRATRIVKNVLLFARNNNYEHGQSSANDVLKDVLRLRQYDENAGNIAVTTRLAEDLPEIAIDRFQMQQVFLNIILNAEAAIKETKRPGQLTVVTERADGHVKIHFIDNGCGIKKSVMPRIFDPFFTTKDIGKGTGLGLSICYGIITKHGGKISVRSQAGRGATFTIEMPIAES